MKEELIAQVAARTGLDPATAEKAVDAVLDYLRENPGKASELLGQHSGAMSKITSMFKR
jgi:nucleoid DNA-binding protein